MDYVRVTDRFAVAKQPRLEDFEALAADGFRALINARPEGEEPGQPSSGAEAKAAQQTGMAYRHVPVGLKSITYEDVRNFQSALEATNGPAIGHCKSGLRALALYTLGEVLDGRMGQDEIAGFGERLGFDLSSVEDWLNRNGLKPVSEGKPVVRGFYEHRTGSIQYVVSDPETKLCAIVDPVLDFDPKSGQLSTEQADAMLRYIEDEGLKVAWILDTHPHADHLSSARYLKEKTGAPTAIGEHVVDVQKLWKGIYNWPDFPADGSQWDHLFKDGETFEVGNLKGRVMFSPGHTLASITYVIGDAAFVHDTIFMPDSGTARADFPGGNAKTLWESIQAILALPDETRLFTGHDYRQGGRPPKWESTVGEEKQKNPHLHNVDEAKYVELRDGRDATLPMPEQILHALQVNMNGGRLPEPEANGRRYFKYPLDALTGAAWE
ncbi:MAG: bifunctional sulfur transferase/dioxygenase Blh [Methyloligella sp. ZOD6]